jgi:hypothetical protein
MKTQGGRGMKALEFTAGPVLLKEKFQVLDIPASFNLLLGRPWIHAIEAVPSTLHQKVKQGNHVISILGDSFLSKCRSLSWQNQSRNIYPCLILVTMSLMEMFRSPPRLGRRHQGILEPIHDQAIDFLWRLEKKKKKRGRIPQLMFTQGGAAGRDGVHDNCRPSGNHPLSSSQPMEHHAMGLLFLS